jgi:ABC-type transport system involved in multi-copper enzyme maturation permease subunit
MRTIALTTFRELIRQKLIHVAFFIALILFALSFLLGSLSFDEQTRILVHFGFSSIQLAVVGISLFIGTHLLPKEIERQTCLIVLSRPIDRAQFYIGKFLGVALINLTIVLILTSVLFLACGLSFSPVVFFMIGLGAYFESLILLAVAFLGSLVLRPAIALFMTVGIFLLGNWLNDLLYFSEKSSNPASIFFGRVVHQVLPQLYRTNWRSLYILENKLLSGDEFFGVTMHVFGWTLMLLVIGTFVFRRKDLV